jgi:aminopeptidase
MRPVAGFDVELLADKTVDLLSVSPGQVIWIWANAASMDFIEALAFRIRARGAFWSLRLNSEPLLRRLGVEAPQEVLGLVPEHELRWLDDVDAIVEVHDHGGALPGVPLERRRALAGEWIALIDAAAKKKIRRVMVVNPTPALAEAIGLPLEELQRRVRQALDVDYAAVDALQERLARRMDAANEVRVASPAGTDLRLRLGDRKALCDTDSLPRGEAYIAPQENSAEGEAVIDQAFVRGKCIQNLRLTFSAGRVVTASAADLTGVESFRELLAASRGEKERIAEFAIGVNPGAREPVGYIPLDEKIGGSVHIAIGMNENFGGRNRSNLHLDLVILQPTVFFDGAVILERGKFCV